MTKAPDPKRVDITVNVDARAIALQMKVKEGILGVQEANMTLESHDGSLKIIAPWQLCPMAKPGDPVFINIGVYHVQVGAPPPAPETTKGLIIPGRDKLDA